MEVLGLVKIVFVLFCYIYILWRGTAPKDKEKKKNKKLILI